MATDPLPDAGTRLFPGATPGGGDAASAGDLSDRQLPVAP